MRGGGWERGGRGGSQNIGTHIQAHECFLSCISMDNFAQRLISIH